MKRTYLLCTFFLFLTFFNLNAQNTYIPDDNFEQELIDLGYDSGELNDSVPTANIDTVTNLIINEKNIEDLTGIEDFASVEYIDCFNNLIVNLDVSYNLNLKTLVCSSNQIRQLDLSNNSLLHVLFCENNEIINLDLSATPYLNFLNCSYNDLTWLNIKNGNNNNLWLDATNNPYLYCIQVDDEETAYSKPTFHRDNFSVYSENCENICAGIPLSEYQCLSDLYYSTLGEEWTISTNWLDTVNSSVAYWYGVTIENGHVTKIELPDNNLQEGVFENPLQLPELEVLDLSGNNLIDANFNNLDSLSNLTSLHIENNNFIFKHIIEIQSLPYYDNFSENFSYAPQGNIDFTEELELTPGDILEMSINPYFISSGDLFQWYKNDSPLEGETNNSYDKTNVALNDSGTYYLIVTNPDVSELTLQSYNKYVSIKDLVGGVPHEEYEALVALYNATDGDNWTNNTNWLDITNHSVADWYGVTVTDGYVTVLNFNNNNLSGEIPSSLGNLSRLAILNLYRNQLYGSIPNSIKNLTELESLALGYNLLGPSFVEGKANPERAIPNELSELVETINLIDISSNKFFFNDIEPFFSWGWNAVAINTQSPFSGMDKTLVLEVGVDTILKLENYLPGEHDQYQWIKDGNWIPGANDSILHLNNVQISDEGGYKCLITNTIAQYTSIYSNLFTVQVNGIHGAGIPLSEYNALKTFYNSTNGDNWNWNTNWLDTTNHSVEEWACVTVEEGHVTEILMDSNNVVGPLPNEIINLPYLEHLALVNNNISGTLPVNIGSLSQLTTLALGENELTGGIPTSIGLLDSLKYLILRNNNLSGNIPSEIGSNLKLEGIWLGYNNLNGEIPLEIGNLVKLRHLNLAHNLFTGKVPSSFGKLTELRTLDLSSNQLVGPLPVELKNLENIYRFDIDNNLIGEINQNKSATTEDNRQIPDELAGLIQMDTLYLGNNKLQFNDIEAIFSWENFDDFNEFIYAPQAAIGSIKNLETYTGDYISLTIDNYFPGPSDRYQWYKNGYIVSGANSASLNLPAVKLSDSGEYYCKITNPVATELILNSKVITLEVSEKIQGAGVPLSEYETLVEIYNTANGTGWINNDNWLDTINHSVNDWFGITVENNHVTGFSMPNNNLSQMPVNLNHLPELKSINLSDGNFEGELPNFENLSNLVTLILSSNNFTFNNLTAISYWSNYNNFKTNFEYSPQAKVGEAETLNYQVDDTMRLEIKLYESEINDHFEWYKNQESISESNSEQFSKKVTFEDNNAEFYCEITNPILPDLTLQSELINIIVSNSSADSLLLLQLQQEFTQLQNLWTDIKVSNWQGVSFENGKITSLDLSGLNLEGNISAFLAGFDSLSWLDLSNNNFSGPFTSLFEKSAHKNSIISEESTLNYLNISNNKFTFADLEPTANELNSIDEFIYTPQSVVGSSIDTSVLKYQSIELTIPNYIPGEFDSYKWFKEGEEISNSSQLNYLVENASLSDSGKYTCLVTNSVFPDLTLFSDTINLKVLTPVGIEDFNDERNISIYPNPGEQRIFVETGNEAVNIKIYDPTGVMLLEKDEFKSDWIDIHSYTPGIYFFKIEIENNGVISRKVIFK